MFKVPILALLWLPQLSKPGSLSLLSKCCSVSVVLFLSHLFLKIEISVKFWCNFSINGPIYMTFILIVSKLPYTYTLGFYTFCA